MFVCVDGNLALVYLPMAKDKNLNIGFSLNENGHEGQVSVCLFGHLVRSIYSLDMVANGIMCSIQMHEGITITK